MPELEHVIRAAHLDELDPRTLYRMLALRSTVFVLEQQCIYLDLDGRDLEQDTVHVWAERGGDVLATLRLLHDPGDVSRIGRVVTAAPARGLGLSARLMSRALDLAQGREIVLDAQTYLLDWYRRFGFERDGDDFVEDGIAHVPMRRPR